MRSRLRDSRFMNLKPPFSHAANLVGFSILLSAILFFFLGCDNAERKTGIATAPEDAAEELPIGEGLDIGAIAPEFSLPDSDGEFRTLSTYRGQKVVIVFYRTGT